ncbi:MAG: hypothetical protein M0036_09895 [Desulfobacteraceae bacterium]|nr:hypothetical protein [Desulfobacteraceae bacterium]
MTGKKLFPPLAAIFLVLILAAGAAAAPGDFNIGLNWGGRAPIASVYLFPQDTDVNDGIFRFDSWGLLSYRLWGPRFQFSLNGFNLERRKSYTLIYYRGSQSAPEIICLGSSTTNRRGFLNITGRADVCSMPSTTDPDYFHGAQIMLVPSDSVVCAQGDFLTPESEKNLITYHSIRFTDTDGCPAENEVNPPPPADNQPPTGGTGTGDPEPSSPPADSGGGSSGEVLPY